MCALNKGTYVGRICEFCIGIYVGRIYVLVFTQNISGKFLHLDKDIQCPAVDFLHHSVPLYHEHVFIY